jgi:hypothetical protein
LGLFDEEEAGGMNRLSWRAIATKLNIPTMTAVAAHRDFHAEAGCTETVPAKMPVQAAKTQRRKRAS